MSLRWNWDEKCGEATIRHTWKGETIEHVVNLYEGNAFLIFINEWKEDDTDKYSLYTFFADETHAKICLGLKENHDGEKSNIFNNELIKLKINKAKCRSWKKIVTLFAQAFDNLDIEIYTEEEEK